MKKISNTIFTAMLGVLTFILLASFHAAENPYKIGDKVDDFKLSDISGKNVALSDYSSEKGVIVIFTCNTCPYAVAYEDRIVALHEQYKKDGFPVLAINPNNPEVQPGDSFDEMKKRAKEKNFGFRYLLDEGQEVYPKFGATRTPQVFLLSNENDGFVLRYIGAIDDNYKDASQVKLRFLEDAIEALKNGRDIQTSETKAIGCTIKTK